MLYVNKYKHELPTKHIYAQKKKQKTKNKQQPENLKEVKLIRSL
jgi:hypothetical protein